MSPPSTKQKAQALDTVTGSCMAYSMPLGLTTVSDASKCAAINLNICTSIYMLPRRLLSALPLGQTIKPATLLCTEVQRQGGVR